MITDVKKRTERMEGKTKTTRNNNNLPAVCNNFNSNSKLQEPVARFLKSYAVFIDDHTGKEDKFFDIVEEKC
jgi:hypothetical protein